MKPIPPEDNLCQSERRRIAEVSLGHQLEWIRSVEQKLTVLVAMATGLLGLFGVHMSSQPEDVKVPLAYTVAFCAPLILSLIYCGLASFPRLRAPNVSILFFGTISAYSREQYTSKFGELDSAQYLRDLLAQIHRNAEIAAVKYGHVRRATMWLLAAALSLTTLLSVA